MCATVTGTLSSFVACGSKVYAVSPENEFSKICMWKKALLVWSYISQVPNSPTP